MVVNTFYHSQDLVFLFGLFSALHCRDSSLLWCLIITERNPIRTAAAVPFSPLTQTHNHSFSAPSVGPSGRKGCWVSEGPWSNTDPLSSSISGRWRVSVLWPLSILLSVIWCELWKWGHFWVWSHWNLEGNWRLLIPDQAEALLKPKRETSRREPYFLNYC